jgi:hypothetical protein
MANSKLLKEAIADAKAVKETALANAKIALEEAFTPRLQSILTQKLRAEAEMEDDAEKVDEELDSTNIGSSTSTPSLDADTEFEAGSTKTTSGEPGAQVDDFKKVADINEEDDMAMGDEESEKDVEIAELKARLAELEGEESEEDSMAGMEMGTEEEDPFAAAGDDMGSMNMPSDDDESEDDMDLEAIIRELEAQLGDEEGSEEDATNEEEEEENPDAEKIAELKRQLAELEGDDSEEEKPAAYEGKKSVKKENYTDGAEAGTDKDGEKVIDLEEILREMEADMTDDSSAEDAEEKEAELNEAYKTIKSLQRTINEVNLLNAKLLFANKLFRAHNMTNEQKVKVIETLDRTKSVREVKLVYSTLAENFKYTSSTSKANKKSITEGIASKVVKSTKPAQAAAKQVIAESADFSARFKQLAGIIK